MNSIYSWIHLHHKRILFISGILIGLIGAIQYAWISDDAYISFIYSRNLWEGNGLVFQLGERVEGYTNFLWTILVTLSFPLGIRIEDFSIGLGILFYFFTLIYLRNPYLVFSYSLFYFGWEFGTSGLETSMFTCAIVASYHYWKNKAWGELFLLATILPLIRPEGAMLSVFYFVYYIVKAEHGERKVSFWLIKRNFIFFALAFFFILMFISKVVYYGDLFPNTFYAKAGEGDYFAQGFLYLFYFYKEYIVFSIFLLVGVVLSRSPFSWMVLAYLFYVIYVGGDFMFSRFLIPIIPVSMILTWDRLNSSFHSWNEKFYSNGKLFSYSILSLFILSPMLSTGSFTNHYQEIYLKTGISHERQIYKNLGKATLTYDLDALKDFHVSFWGAQAHFVYYLRPKLAIESSTGLTDLYIARRKIDKRGTIGHEKKAPIEYLRERGVNIVMADVYGELGDSRRDLIYKWGNNLLTWKILDLDQDGFNYLNNHPNFNTSRLDRSIWSNINRKVE
jgi:hypothetical protein